MPGSRSWSGSWPPPRGTPPRRRRSRGWASRRRSRCGAGPGASPAVSRAGRAARCGRSSGPMRWWCTSRAAVVAAVPSWPPMSGRPGSSAGRCSTSPRSRSGWSSTSWCPAAAPVARSPRPPAQPESPRRCSTGPHAAAIAVYLYLGQHLPVQRTASLLAEVFGTPMAAGTVAAWTARAAAGLAPFTAAARAALAEAELVHADETGLHVACRRRFTGLFCHRKRGTQAIDAAGVLPHFTGIAVHDAFTSYTRYPAVTHALCNAHLLRELIAVVYHHLAHPA